MRVNHAMELQYVKTSHVAQIQQLEDRHGAALAQAEAENERWAFM